MTNITFMYRCYVCGVGLSTQCDPIKTPNSPTCYEVAPQCYWNKFRNENGSDVHVCDACYKEDK